MAKTQQKGTSIGDGTITEVDINISGATVKSPLLGSDYLFIRDSVLNTTQQILVSTLDDYYASKYFPSADNMSYAVSAGSYSFVPTTAYGRSLLGAVSGTMFTGLNADTVDGFQHNQSLLTTATPTFAGLNVGTVGKIATFGDATITSKWISIRNADTTGIAIGLLQTTTLGGLDGIGLIRTGSSKGFGISVNNLTAFNLVTTVDFSINYQTKYVTINSAVATSSVGTGALVVGGGVGINGGITLNGTIVGATTITGTSFNGITGLTTVILPLAPASTAVVGTATLVSRQDHRHPLQTGYAITTTTTGISITNGAGASLVTGTAINIGYASTNVTGLLTATDWNTFNNKGTFPGFGTLDTTNEDGTLIQDIGESFGGTIMLHMVSKTGNYNDLVGKPTSLSQFTNNLGNYGGFLTSETDTLNTVTSRGNYTTGKMFVNATLGTVPGISLAIGDTDTGFNWIADGNIEYWKNSAKMYSMDAVWHSGNFNPNGKLDWRTFGTAANYNTGDFLYYCGNLSSNVNADTVGNGMWLNTVGNGTGNSGFANQYGAFIGFDNGFGGFQFDISNDNVMKTRSKWNSSWSAWQTSYNSGNLTNTLTTNYLPKWNGSSLVNSLIMDDGTNVIIKNGTSIHFNAVGDGIFLSRSNIGAESVLVSDGSYNILLGAGADWNKIITNKIFNITNTTASNSVTTGALVVNGGVGIGGSVNVSGNITANVFNGSGVGLTTLPVTIDTAANSTYGGILRLGGDSLASGVSTIASVMTTNGNLHLDAGTGNKIYLNFYQGAGINFGNGASAIVMTIDTNGSIGTSGNVSALGFYGDGTNLTGRAMSFTTASSYNMYQGISVTDRDPNTFFTETQPGSRSYAEGANATPNGAGGSWWFYENIRHTNASNIWGKQYAHGWEDNANRLKVRNVSSGTWGGWVEFITTANIGTQNCLNIIGPAHTNGNDGWFRSDGDCGWYSQNYNVGIYATETGNVRTYNNANFIASDITAQGGIKMITHRTTETTGLGNAIMFTNNITVYGINDIASIRLNTESMNGSESGGLTFNTKPNINSTSLVEAMRLAANGNVIIGTTNDRVGKLQVQGDTFHVYSLNNPDSVTNARQIVIGEASANTVYDLSLGYFSDGTGWKGSIQVVAGGVPATLVINGNGGSVLIGQTNGSNSSKLQVNGTINAVGYSTSWSGTNSVNTGGFNTIMGIGASATWLLSGTSSGTFRYGIQGLDSGGALKIYVGTANVSIDSIANITANNFILGSDRRIKTNIEPINITNLDINYKEFEMLSNVGEKRYGVIAQELREIAPELVMEDKQGMLSVKYVDLLIREVASLKNRIKELEDK